ncbi:MAG: homoserine kinase, partial [Atopobiaceae bacterium]|nr:homoserine kinase [Atopobiaceae bacterium]
FRGEDNLVWTSYLHSCGIHGFEPKPLHIDIDSPIPLSGGLGSSSACVVAGIVGSMLVNGIAPEDLDEKDVLRIAVAIEGHPDNVAPAILGGVVSSFVLDGETISTRVDVAEQLRFVTIAPPFEVRTEAARAVMPKQIPIETAIWQMGRCMPTVQALQNGDLELLAKACDDRLHEPYRRKLIPCYDEVRAAAFGAGAAAFFISGSGSSMIAVCDDDDAAATIASAFSATVEDSWVRILRANEVGYTIG